MWARRESASLRKRWIPEAHAWQHQEWRNTRAWLAVVHSIQRRPEVLLEEVGAVQGLVGVLEALEAGEGIGSEGLSAPEQDVAEPFQHPAVLLAEAPDDVAASRIHSGVGGDDDVVPVVDDGRIGEDLLDRSLVGRPHLHGDGLERGVQPFQAPEDREERVGTAAIAGVDDHAALEIEHDRDVPGALPDRERGTVPAAAAWPFAGACV